VWAHKYPQAIALVQPKIDMYDPKTHPTWEGPYKGMLVTALRAYIGLNKLDQADTIMELINKQFKGDLDQVIGVYTDLGQKLEAEVKRLERLGDKKALADTRALRGLNVSLEPDSIFMKLAPKLSESSASPSIVIDAASPMTCTFTTGSMYALRGSIFFGSTTGMTISSSGGSYISAAAERA